MGVLLQTWSEWCSLSVRKTREVEVPTRTPLTVAIALATVACHAATEPPKPPAPSSDVPKLEEVNPAVLCIGCDDPFDPTTHKRVLDGLVSSPYVAALRKALYQQDIVHQFESKAHFDNCDFDSSATYITTLLDEVGVHVEAARKAKAAGEKKGVESAAEKAFFAIGQALHSVQDFYAHTNYVELQAPKVTRIVDIPVIAPWRPKGQERIQQLRKEGLFSGYVFWGFPQKCPDGTPSHSEVAKDSATTASGAKPLANLQNLSQYKAAVFLAREASLLLMTDAFKKWPLLKELNGQHVAFEVPVDRRGLDGGR